MPFGDVTRAVIVVMLCGVVAFVAGCSDGVDPAEAVNAPESSQACDDRIALVDEPPAAARADGMTDGVGSGDIWFFAPAVERWGDVVIPMEAGFQGKLPMWVGTDDLPAVSVARMTGDPLEGTMTLSPTSDGLPGPLPAGAFFPSPGCWQITATSGADTAQITVGVQ